MSRTESKRVADVDVEQIEIQVELDQSQPTDEEVLACIPATGDLDLEEGLPERVADALVRHVCNQESLWGSVDLRLARAILAEQLHAAAAGIVDLAPLHAYLSAGPDTRYAASRCVVGLANELELLGFHAVLPDEVRKRAARPRAEQPPREGQGAAEEGPSAVVVCAPIFAALACLAVLFGMAL